MKRMKQEVTGDDVDVSHFTLVSNINCGPDEINVYETAYRSRSALLTDEQKKVLKALTKSKNLVVHCINVVPQKEAECAAISVALAVKLCFSARGERGLFKEFVREGLKIDIGHSGLKIVFITL